MADRIVKVTSQSWRQRMGGSFRGAIFGVLMVGLGVWLLFWNEGRAVKRAKALSEGAASVVSVDGGGPQSAHEGKLVHFTGEATSEAVLRDAVFGVDSRALKLERKVEMYQWREESHSEERKKLGGGTETVTTYTYTRDWSSRAIDSSSFEEPQGHRNPAFRFEEREWVADPITIGDWRLTAAFVGKLSRSQPLSVGEAERLSAADSVRSDLRLSEGGFYLGDNPRSPEVGDVKISFSQVPYATVSVVGLQQSGELVPYTARVGGSIALLSYGAVAADAMFESAKAANTQLLWILRVVGFFVVMFGFRGVLRPLSVTADVVPMIGNLVERGTGWISFALAAFVALVTIAIGWIWYRPLLGIFLLVLAVAVAVWIVRRARRPARPSVPAPGERAAPPPPPPPPAAG